MLMKRDQGESADLHQIVQAIMKDQVMRHANPMRLHWMALAIVVVPKFRIIVVGHLRSSVESFIDDSN